jgi:tellurite resistance protein TerC
MYTQEPLWVWIATVLAFLAVYTGEFIYAKRHPHVVQFREAAKWVVVYISAAILFGVGMWRIKGQDAGFEFFAGWITEYSLSVDNLFVFVIILSAFAVPAIYQQEVLQVGIIGALVLRFLFIIVGAAAIARFSWVFFIFGAFLLYTAYKLATNHGTESDNPSKNTILVLAEKYLPVTPKYHEGLFMVKIDGKKYFTPLFIVMIAIFTTDILFALDSIPAIFGLTDDAYIVFTANAFALMGLRQMYFMLDGLLDRLIYLSYGLSVILGFIGMKLIFHAAHENGFESAPEISTPFSLAVIVGVLALTIYASLRQTKLHPELAHKPGQHAAGSAIDDIKRDHPGVEEA